MYIRSLFIFIFCISSCGVSPMTHKQISVSSMEKLETRTELYRSRATNGWQSYSKSDDGLLFACLSAVALNREFAVELARNPDGQWFRNPGAVLAPLEQGHSTISRDMFTGLFMYILHFQRLDLAEQIWEYGEARGWKMGEETREFDNRVYFTPTMISLLARIIHHLGGTDHYLARLIPQVYSTIPGYESHLSLLTIQMIGNIQGHIGLLELGALNKILKHMAHNPLAQALFHKYTDGDQSIATELLLDIWPSDRLPNKKQDWCEDWRTQRSDGDTGFGLCPKERNPQHSGADFLYVSALIQGDI